MDTVGKDTAQNGTKLDTLADTIDTEECEHRCGYFAWQPDWLKRLNKPGWLLVCVMFMSFTQGEYQCELFMA